MSRFEGKLAIQQRVLPSYRVGFIDYLNSLCDGGVTVFAGEPLQVEGINVTPQLGSAEFTSGINLHFRDPSYSNYLCWQSGLLAWLKVEQPDALIVEANPRILSTHFGILQMGRMNRPVLGWGLGVGKIKNPIWHRIRQRFFGRLDGMISYSKKGEEEYKKAGMDHVWTAHNSVSFQPKSDPPKRSYQSGIKPSLLFVGRLQKRKKLDVLLRALSKLDTEKRPRLIIVGDGPYRKELEANAHVEYPDTVFVGAKHGDQLLPYFQEADIFVLPGTGGLAVQQAMSHGLPVIIAEGDGTQDDLVRDQNGWQVQPGNVEMLSEIILEAISDLQRLRKMGEESFKIIKEEVNLEKMAEVFVKALNTVAHGDI
jgi:glycosyltransferase involved in cell wall biosynthesis